MGHCRQAINLKKSREDKERIEKSDQLLLSTFIIVNSSKFWYFQYNIHHKHVILLNQQLYQSFGRTPNLSEILALLLFF